MAESTENISVLLELKHAQFEKSAKSAEAAINRLERRFNPLAAAEQKLEKQQLRFNTALEAGTIDAAQHAKGMALLSREYDNTVARATGATKAITSMNAASAKGAGVFGKHAFKFQQFGYQAGDAAVQIQGGTSALTALTQQGSQMLGVFGPMGAVMGAVLAIGAPLAATLLNLGESTEGAKKKAKAFQETIDEVEAAMSRASSAAELASQGGLEALGDRYGEITQQVRELALELYKIEERGALQKMGGVLDELIGGDFAKQIEASFGSVGQAIVSSTTEEGKRQADELAAYINEVAANISQRQSAGFIVDQGEIENLRMAREELAALQGDMENIGTLSEGIKLSPELITSIQEMQARLSEAREAGDFAGMADALSDMRAAIQDAGADISVDLIDNMVSAEDQARRMADMLNQGKDAAEGIAAVDTSGGIAAGANEAARLAQNLGISLDLARRIAGFGPQGAAPQGGRGGDPRNMGGSALDWQNREGTEFLANWKAPKTGGGKRGGGGKSSGKSKARPLFENAEASIISLERQIDMIGKSKSEIAGLTAKYKLLDEAKKRGLDLDAKQAGTGQTLAETIDAQAASMERLTEQYERGQASQAQFESGVDEISDALAGAIVDGEDWRESMANIFKGLARDILQSGIKQSILSVFKAPKAGGGGFLSNLFGGGGLGGLLSFDGGGFTGAGARSGGIDGKGGFPAMLHPNETVVDHTKSGGGGGGTSAVRIELGEGLIGSVLQAAGNQAVQIVSAASRNQQQSLPASMRSVSARGTT